MKTNELLRAAVKKHTGIYWESAGRYQKLSDKINPLVPESGAAEDKHVELFRIMCNIYHDWYNNGGGNMCDQGPKSGLVAQLDSAEEFVRPLLRDDNNWDCILDELKACAAKQVCEECNGSQLMECSECHGNGYDDTECPTCQDDGEEDCHWCDEQVTMGLDTDALEDVVDAVVLFCGEGLGFIDKTSDVGILAR